jgi:hypothetical protein
MIKLKLFVLFTFIPILTLSQETKLSEIITSAAEELAAEEDEPETAELFIDRLYELTEDPVKINSGDEDEISRLFFLTDFQVRALADYIKINGKIVSVFEIANIPGFDKETTEMMAPFITFDSSFRLPTDSKRERYTLLSNFILKPSTSDSLFPGSPWKILTKCKYMAGSFIGGFTIEKDPGEKLLYGNPSVPDFFSAYMSWQGAGLIKRVIIGDYSVRFGQGTGINTGIRTGLSLTTPGYLAGKNDIRPYTSTDENNFFRGTAVDLSYKKFDLSLFVSSLKTDATLNDSGSSIKSLYKTGLHNSPGTILKKDAVSEISYGLNLSYNFNNLRTGILWTENMFSLPFVQENISLSDKYNFRGNRNTLYTIYYNWLIKRFILFGEFSYSGLNKYAFVQGMSVRPVDRLNINFIYRNYRPGFVSFHGNGPTGSSLNNESGLLGNITFEAAKFLFVSAGSNIRYFQWLRYRCSAPSTGRKHEIRIRYLPTDKLSFEALYDHSCSMVDNTMESGVPIPEKAEVQSVRGYVKYSPAENILFGTRLDYKAVNPSGSKGMLLLQDISIRFRGMPVSIWVRYCVFNTGGFESGIYTWENDLLNSFSIPVMYGSGNRCYIMVSWKPGYSVELRFKYSLTMRESGGSTTDIIPEIKMQLKINI